MQIRFDSQFGTTSPFSGSIENHPDLAGFTAARRSAGAQHQKRVTEAARLFADVLTGELDPVFLREAMNPRNEVLVMHLVEKYPDLYPRSGPLALRETMSVTDYQALFADVLDRVYYGFYNAFPIVNKAIVRSHALNDFRQRKIYMLDGAVTPLTNMDAAAPAPEKSLSGPVPQDGASFPTTNTAAVEYAPALWQSSTATNWRAFVNDDLGIFRDLARRLAIQGNRGISKYITGLFFQSNGLNTGLYAAGYRNLITTTYGAGSSNPALSAQGLQDAWKVLAGQRDSSGDPIMVTGKPYLVYGPALKATAENLKSSTRSMISVEGGTTNSDGFPSQFVEAANWAMQNMELVMDPYMPIVMSGAAGSIANTAWALVLDPQAQDRPCVEVGFLKGFETPQIYERVPNTQRLGGGLEPMMGDFDSMDSRMKIVTVFAGTQVDGRSTVASTGAGS
jgi:hypothetical protein